MSCTPEFDTKRCKLLICLKWLSEFVTTAVSFERRVRVS